MPHTRRTLPPTTALATAALLAILAGCSGSDEILPADGGADGSGGSGSGHDASEVIGGEDAPGEDVAGETDPDAVIGEGEADDQGAEADDAPADDMAAELQSNACGGTGALTFGGEPAAPGDPCHCDGVLVCEGGDADLLTCSVAPCAEGEVCADVDGVPMCAARPAEVCDNGADDDEDGRVDCDDDDCVGEPACERVGFELSWAGDADLDIRLRHQNGCWNDEAWAVSFLNRTPDWGDDGAAALDIDDLGTGGVGAENIVLTGPADEVTYHVAAFNTRGGTASARLRVLVGGTAVFDVSRDLGPADVQWDIARWTAGAAAEVDAVHAAEATTCD